MSVDDRWKALAGAVCFGAAVGGGTATGIYQIGPGADLSRDVRANSENQIRLSGQLEYLTRATDALADKVAELDAQHDKSGQRIDKLEYDLNTLKATVTQDMAAIRATQTENIARLDRELVKLSDKVGALKP